jgi:hypothetical protein
MANTDFPKGFWPTRHLAGGVITAREYVVTTGATVYKGEVLKVVAAGTVESSTANDGVIVIGVAAEYVNDSGSAGGKKVMVYDDPNIVFAAQMTTGQTPTAADVFSSANHVAGAGSTTTYLSADEVGASAGGGQLIILGKVEVEGNAWGAHVDLEVIFAEHMFRAALAGV